MHRYDERTQRIADAVFAYTRDRLALDPVPLDHGDRARRARRARARTSSDAAGNDPDARARALQRGARAGGDLVRQPALPRVHPRRAHEGVAAVRHDRVVRRRSRASRGSKAAGAVHAENQALRFLADLAGLPATRGRRVRAGRLGRATSRRSSSRASTRRAAAARRRPAAGASR